MKKLILFFLIIIASAIELYSQTFPRGQTLVSGEYFINNDPGQGNGTPISTIYNSLNIDVSFNAQVPQGSVIYIRFKSSNGTWSAPRSIKNLGLTNSGSTLVSGEYFLNSDPGVGNGTALTIGLNGQINIPSIVLNKNDVIYIRVRDSFGRWSSARGMKYRYKNLIAAQYYIKYANGSKTQIQNMSLSNQPFNSPFFNATASVTTSLMNNDTVYVRFQSDDFFLNQWVKQAGTITGITDNKNNLPKEFKIYNAYPNPFNPSTIIEYDIPKASEVRLDVFDILGRNIATLVNDKKAAGSYKVEFNASSLASGIYFYKIQAGSFVETKKLIVLK